MARQQAQQLLAGVTGRAGDGDPRERGAGSVVGSGWRGVRDTMHRKA